MATTAAHTVDVLIIGGGPAGLATALGLSRQLYRTVLFDSGVYRNARSKHMHTVPTWDHQDAAAYRASARKELGERYKTAQIVDRKVDTVRKLKAVFEAVDAEGQTWTGRKVVLANGVRDLYPDILGYDDCWGRSVFHCLFCHGYEERGAPHAGLLAVEFMANPPMALGVACMAKNLASRITIYTHGNAAFTAEIRDSASQQGLSLDDREIARLEHVADESEHARGVRIRLHFADGSGPEELGFLAHTPRTEPSAPWREQLGLETTATGDFKVNQPFGESTNVAGVFAVGDTGNMMKAVNVAVMSGVGAAAGIAHALSQGK